MKRQGGTDGEMPGGSMNAQSIEQEYITVAEIARESGQSLATVYNWLRYHGYLEYERVLDKTVVRRAKWNEFRRENPGKMKRKAGVVDGRS